MTSFQLLQTLHIILAAMLLTTLLAMIANSQSYTNFRIVWRKLNVLTCVRYTVLCTCWMSTFPEGFSTTLWLQDIITFISIWLLYRQRTHREWTDRGTVWFQSVGDDQTVVSVSLVSLRSRNSSGRGDADDGCTSELTANSTRHDGRSATGAAYHGLSRRTWLTLVLAADSEFAGDGCEYPCSSAAYTPVYIQ